MTDGDYRTVLARGALYAVCFLFGCLIIFAITVGSWR